VLPSFDGAITWLNSPPLTPAGLRGKVVLVDFWTYTCINWLRTLPYVRAWAEKYTDHGVVVIGVHTPEFPFEHDVANVRRAATDMRVAYPIAVDSDYAVWRAFDNHYWPALYIVDAQGQLRHHHVGEGAYDRAEMVIQHLLAEAGRDGVDPALVSVDARGIEAPADWDSVHSPAGYDLTGQLGDWGTPQDPGVPAEWAHGAPGADEPRAIMPEVTQHAMTERLRGFTPAERARLRVLRDRYQASRTPFTTREVARLHFVRCALAASDGPRPPIGREAPRTPQPCPSRIRHPRQDRSAALRCCTTCVRFAHPRKNKLGRSMRAICTRPAATIVWVRTNNYTNAAMSGASLSGGQMVAPTPRWLRWPRRGRASAPSAPSGVACYTA
jgi:thiol-disulfide isomerase/thioredoxin